MIEDIVGWYHQEEFRGVKGFCIFIGHPRSGYSIIGSLLDAHPRAIVAHELDCLASVRKEVSKRRLFSQLILRSRQFARQGARWSGYSAAIPSQHKGEFTSLQIIGDKKGWNTTFHLRHSPELLSELGRTVEMPVKVIHVKRHPLENISTMARKNMGGDLDAAIDKYFLDCETVRVTREEARGRDWVDWFDLNQERFICNTKSSLRKLWRFLGSPAPEDYLEDCAEVVFDTPNRSRKKVTYEPRHLSRIREESSAFPSLAHYDPDSYTNL